MNTIDFKNKMHMSQLSLSKRLLGYLLILLGYFFYCYNFTVVDYVKPFLNEHYGITLKESSLFYTFQSLGCFVGAVCSAWFSQKAGKKTTLIIVTAISGICTIINMSIINYPLWCLMRFLIGVTLGGYYTIAVSSMVGLFKSTLRGRVYAIAESLFAFSQVVMGAYGAYLSETGWEKILWLGAFPPVAIAIFMVFFVPDEKKYTPYGNNDKEISEVSEVQRGTWGEMFTKKYRRLTITCALISAFNFLGIQFYGGFLTVYLREVRGFDATNIGIIMASGATIGTISGLIWGYLSDRFGRIFNAFGFLLVPIAITLYYLVPSNITLLSVIGAIFNLACSSQIAWGSLFTELFPERLRSMGASLFFGGKIIALMGPFMVVIISEHATLSLAMWFSPVLFLIATLLWFSLPEPNKRGIFYKNYDADYGLSKREFIELDDDLIQNK
ncbi:MFS transporter [Priestia megaterium]|uniref:MFS transporter n=1 Tax=Priestia megaterium TaxID=1404 RepID=UPI000BF97E72|nr:MFS transporter [Priestia megaterium]PFI59472.1 MFS transporter [Priestia megaterium]PFT49828.1 MFS transporter [Priestia megaterium]